MSNQILSTAISKTLRTSQVLGRQKCFSTNVSRINATNHSSIFDHHISFSAPMTDVVFLNMFEQKHYKVIDSMQPFSIMDHPMSFSAAMADAVAPSPYEQESCRVFKSVNAVNIMDHNISFGNAMSDVMAPTVYEQENCRVAAAVNRINIMDHHMSFGGALSDSTSPSFLEQENCSVAKAMNAGIIDHHMSFSAPMADAMAPSLHEQDNCSVTKFMNSSIFDHPMSFGAAMSDTMAPSLYEQENCSFSKVMNWNILDHYMSFSAPMADAMAPSLYEQQNCSIINSLQSPAEVDSSLSANIDEKFFADVPRSYEEVVSLNSPLASQAVVITETTAPFRIVHVNKAWENLCGFSYDEAVGQTLQILQNSTLLRTSSYLDLMDKLETPEERDISTVLINYRKDGSAFMNHLRIIPLQKSPTDRQVTHLLGVLEEVSTFRATA